MRDLPALLVAGRRNGQLTAARWLFGGWGLVILAMTLPPQEVPELVEPLRFWCVACGTRGSADAILNWLAFVPGGLLGSLTLGPVRTLLGLVGGSAFLEALQSAIPGRHPGFSDLLFNCLGAATGVALTFPGLARLARKLAPALAAVAWLSPAFLLAPAPAGAPIYGQWKPVIGGMDAFPGSVVSARLGPEEVPSWRMTEAAREALAAHAELQVGFRYDATPERLSSVFAIADERTARAVIVAADRNHLAYYRKGWAAALRLEQPFLWLATPPPTPSAEATATVTRQGGSVCVSASVSRGCAPLPGPERGWQFLWGGRMAPGTARSLISLVWCLGLGILIGLGHRSAVAALGTASTLAVIGWWMASWSAELAAGVPWAPALVAAAAAGAWVLRSISPPPRGS